MIDFKLERIFFCDNYTIGHLYYSFDNKNYIYLCDTIEDKRRPTGVKIYGKTCIEDGVYKFIMSYSPKFKKVLPYILDVPMFESIRIHWGTDEESSLGCIILGENKIKGKVINSRISVDKLITLLDDNTQEQYTINIIDKK